MLLRFSTSKKRNRTNNYERKIGKACGRLLLALGSKDDGKPCMEGLWPCSNLSNHPSNFYLKLPRSPKNYEGQYCVIKRNRHC